VFTLAEKKIGALMILERQDRVGQWITGGQELEAQAGREILLSVFQKESPLHDGAVVIRNGRLVLVTCYLPLSSDEDLPKAWGTRHRAAIGLSEKCDAIVVVVSEEKGEVTFVFQKKATAPVSPDQLSLLVQETLQPVAPPKPGWKSRGLSLLLHRWKAKAGTLALVLALWLLLAGQQNFEVALTLPLEARNIPAEMELVEPLDSHVRIRVIGLRKDAGSLTEKNVRVVLDLAAAAVGRRTFLITREEILLPNERVSIVSIEPSQITFRFQQKTNT
jgi:diadenylate cyclase